MDRLQLVLDRLPAFYNKDAQDSKIRAIVKAFTDEMAITDVSIDMVDDLTGIDTTYGTELDRIWGSMLGIPRIIGEEDGTYRNRMKVSVTNLVGGTEQALKYSIAVILGIDRDPAATDRRVTVTDAWLYTGIEPIDKSKGCSVCVIDLDGGAFGYKSGVEATVQEAINRTKASGVKVQLIFKNYRLMTYTEMASNTYVQLAAFRYNQMGDTK